MPNPLTPDFFDFYPKDAFLARKENDKTRPDGSHVSSLEYEAYRTRYGVHRDVLAAALGQYLCVLRDAELLTPVEFTERRGHGWAEAWNNFVEKVPAAKNSWGLNTVTRPIQSALNMSMLGEDVDAAYDRGITQVNAGFFQFWEFSEAENLCKVTGEKLHIGIEAGWKPQLGTADYKLETFSPLTEDAPLPSVRMAQIPAPTGEMLITDWFRFKDNAFTTLVTNGAPEDRYSTSVNRASLTDLYASRYGFMSVQAGDSSTGILQREDHLVIGVVDEDSPCIQDGEYKGRVNNDLHWVTMIDRSILVELLATQMPRVQAEQEVAACIEAQDITTVQMPVGQVYFYYTTDKMDLAHFSSDSPFELNKDPIEEPYVVISGQPLVWEPLAQPSKAPRPR